MAERLQEKARNREREELEGLNHDRRGSSPSLAEGEANGEIYERGLVIVGQDAEREHWGGGDVGGRRKPRAAPTRAEAVGDKATPNASDDPTDRDHACQERGIDLRADIDRKSVV